MNFGVVRPCCEHMKSVKRCMNIIVNGEPQDVQGTLTVEGLLQSMDLRTDRVAVEINLTILDRSDFPTWSLKDGDKVEILSFIGGGAPLTFNQ